MEEDAAKIVALGSNLGAPGLSPQETLERAVTALSDAGLTVVKRSSWWRSAAWPDPSDPPFLNGVALVETDLSPEDALGALHAIEAAFGRDRSPAAPRNAPRPLDLDLIAWGRLAQAGPPTLPHPRAAERRFVMGPLTQIAPGWLHPTLAATAAALADLAPIGADAHPYSSPLAGEEGARGSQSRGKVRGSSLDEQHRRAELLLRAKAMRKAPTDAEARLWLMLRRRSAEGWKFRRQVPIGLFIADFVCFERRLIVEADGSQHAGSAYDERRDAWFREQGFRVLRFWNNDILQEEEGVVATILQALKAG